MPSLEEGTLPSIIDAKSWQQPTLVTAKSTGSAVLAAHAPDAPTAAQPTRWWWRSGSSGVVQMPKLAKIKVKVRAQWT